MSKITKTTTGVTVGDIATFSNVFGDIGDSGVSTASLQGAITLTTTGNSGPATLTGNTLNIPDYIPTSEVSSFSGDGTLLTNSGSTGTVTATLGTAAAHAVFAGPTSGAAATPTYRQLAFTDISGTAANAQIPAPTISSLGGVEAMSGATANQFVTYLDTSGVHHTAQPSFSNLSGSATAAQLPLATSSAVGAVEPDNTSIVVNGSGVISAGGSVGTFTPTISASGTAGTPTYTAQVGNYVKIPYGNGLYAYICEWAVTLSSWAGSPSGNITIGGFPASFQNLNTSPIHPVRYNAISSLPTGGTGLIAAGTQGASTISILSPTATSNSALTAANAGTAFSLNGSMIIF